MTIPFSELNAAQLERFQCRVVQRYAHEKMPPLERIEIFLTDDCTLQCDYCFVRNKQQRRMSWNVAKKAVDFLMERSSASQEVTITFFGGEPLMEFELMKRIAEYACDCASKREKKITYSVTTNGMIMNEEIAMFGQKYGFNYMLSIDGGRESHDLHRICAGGKNGSWDIVMGENFRLLKQTQGWMGSRYTIAPDTVRHFFHGVETLLDKGVNQFILGPDFDAEWAREEMDILESEYNKVVDLYLEARNAGQHCRIAEFEKTPEELRSSLTNTWGCDAGRTRLAISTDGDLFPCSRFVKPFPGMESYKLGSLDEGLTNISGRMEFIDNHLDKHPECTDCARRDLCNGGCPATNLHLTGSIYKSTEFQCFNTRLNYDLLTRIHSSAQTT